MQPSYYPSCGCSYAYRCHTWIPRTLGCPSRATSAIASNTIGRLCTNDWRRGKSVINFLDAHITFGQDSSVRKVLLAFFNWLLPRIPKVRMVLSIPHTLLSSILGSTSSPRPFSITFHNLRADPHISGNTNRRCPIYRSAFGTYTRINCCRLE